MEAAMSEFERLLESDGIYVENASNTSSDKSPADEGWAQYWIDNNILKMKDLGICRACGKKYAEHGAHVFVPKRAINVIISLKKRNNFFNRLFIVPLCPGCNEKKETLGPFRVWFFDLVLEDSPYMSSNYHRWKRASKYTSKGRFNVKD